MNRKGLPEGYISVYEFAKRTSTTADNVYKLLWVGKLPGAKRFNRNRRWGIPERAVAERLAQREGVANG